MSDDFVVNDKRLFSKDGQVNQEAAEPEKNEPAQQPRPDLEDVNSAFGGAAGSGRANPPPADFAGLVIGLATSAFIHMGEADEGEGSQAGPDLAAAKHAIDLLAVLQAKTKGNLEQEEEALLNTLLYDLRLKFVQASSKK